LQYYFSKSGAWLSNHAVCKIRLKMNHLVAQALEEDVVLIGVGATKVSREAEPGFGWLTRSVHGYLTMGCVK
jgi:hypothetical protein